MGYGFKKLSMVLFKVTANAKAMRMAEERSLRIGSVIYSTFYSL